MADDKKVKIIIEYASNSKEAIADAKRLESALNQVNPSAGKRVDYDSAEFKKKTEAFKKGVEGVKKETEELGEITATSTGHISKMGVALGTFAGNVASSGLQMLLDYAVKGASAMFSYELSLNAVEKKFANVIGNAQLATQHLKDLRSFALKQGADENWVISTAKDLERLKVPANEVLSILRAVGDSVAGTGGDEKDKQAIGGVLENVIKTKRASLETIQSLRDSGISETDIWTYLQRETGKTREELFNLAKAGKLTSETFIKAYKDMSNVKFAGKMKEESETLAGSIKTLADAYWYFLSKGVDKGFDMVNSGGWIQNAAKWMKERVANDTPQVNNTVPKRIDYTSPQSIANAKKNAVQDFNSNEYQQQLETQKQKLDNFYADRFDIISQNLRLQETQLNAHLKLTNQDELNYLNQQKSLRDYYLKQQISEQSKYFDQQIALNKGNDLEVEKLTRQKNEKIRSLNTDLQTNEISTQKAIAEVERRVLESRRQSVIEFKRLQMREVSQVADAGNFDINRTLGLSGDLTEIKANFDKLRNLTNSEYQINTKLISEQFDIQLQNERLTWEEKINLNKTKFLDLQNLSERHRQKLQEIDDRAREKEITTIGQSYSRTSEIQNAQFQQIQTRFQLASVYSQNYALDFKKSIESIKNDVKLFATGENNYLIDGLTKLGVSIKSAPNQPNEKFQLDAIKSLNDFQNKLYETRKQGIEKQLSVATKGSQEEINLQHQLTLVQNEELQSRLNFALNYAEKYFQTLDGMKERLDAIRSGKANADLKNEAEKNSVSDISNSYQEIYNLKERISNFDEISNLEIVKAKLQDILELRQKEVDAVIGINRAQTEISTKTVFSQNQANAIVLEHLASVKSLNESYADARVAAIDLFWNGIEYAADKATSKLGVFKGLVSQLIVDFIKLATLKPLQNFFNVGGTSGGQSQNQGFSANSLLRQFLGGGSGGGSSTSGGTFGAGFGGGFGSPNVFSFAGGGSNQFRGDIGGLGFSLPTGSISNDSFNVSGGGGRNEFAGNSVANITNAVGSQVSNYTKFKSLFSGKGNLIGSLAPMLGMSLGGSLGGQSMGGQILGSIGGLAGGLLGGIATGAINASTMLGGIFGSSGALGIGGLSAAMSATVILAPIAGALLIGSLLLKRNAARRRDETTRDKLMVDTLADLNKIKAEMEAAKPGVSVQSLLDQTGEISANYFTQANALKDKKTRGIAIKDGNERVGVVPPNSQFPSALTNQIYALSENAKMKEQMRMFADERDKRIIPMFASGVYMDRNFASQYGDFKRRNGMLQGAWTGRDTLPSMLAMGEMVLNPMQIKTIRQRAGFDVFDGVVPNYQPKFEMPKFAEGVNLGSSTSTNSKFAPVINFSPNLSMYISQNEDGDFEGYLESEDGQKKVIKIYKNAKKRKEIP